jgi:ABC-type multidrug transport system fused ATPase/permease subunit
MTAAISRFAVVVAVLVLCTSVVAQEVETPPAVGEETAVEQPATAAGDAAASEDSTSAVDEAEAAADKAADEFDKVVEQVDQSQQAQEVKTSILAPIYQLAEKFSFPVFHWLAFAAMVTGVVSFALQLVLGKLVVLSRMSLSPTEVLSDALGLAVSLVGLVLTTQAATENSTFTTSAFSVISATVAGLVLGVIFYVWGQRQELQAVEGRRVASHAKRVDERING